MADTVARLGRSLDPEQRWILERPCSVRTTKSKAALLKDTRSGNRHCSHVHERAALQAWLEGLAPGQSLCPRCAQVRGGARRSARGGGAHVSARSNNVDQADDDTGEKPPPFLDNCIKWHFAPRVNPPQGVVRLGTSRIPGAGMGAFAAVNMPVDDMTLLGVYGGEVMYLQAEVKASQSQKIMSFDLWNNLIHIDGTNSWHGGINHQWEWPYDRFTDDELRQRQLFRKSPRPEWLGVFANVDVASDGIVFTARSILVDEELTIDYGIDFWRDKAFRPAWDLRGLSALSKAFLVEELRTDPLLRELVAVSNILT